MYKKVILSLIIFASLIILVALARQIISALEAGKRLDKEVLGLSQLQQENSKLREKLSEVGKIDFVEEQLRDKLNQSKPNETIVIIPKPLLDEAMIDEKPVEEVKLPNWQGWLKLFL